MLQQQIAQLEKRVAQLEAGPSRLRAPLQIVNASGDSLATFGESPELGAVLTLFSAGGEPGVVMMGRGAIGVSRDQAYAAVRIREDGRGSFVVRDGEKTLAELGSAPDSGAGFLKLSGEQGASVEANGNEGVSVLLDDEVMAGLEVSDEQGSGLVFVEEDGRRVATLSADSSRAGALTIADSTGKALVSIAETPKSEASVTIGREGRGFAVSVFGSSKQPLVSLGAAKVGGGTVAAYNSQGTIGAILSGTGQVHVADGGGQTFATMVAENGQGAVSVRNKGGTTIVRLGEGANGGLMQIAGADGNAMVEAGVLPGRGVVRAYPLGSPGVGLVGMPGTFISGFGPKQ